MFEDQATRFWNLLGALRSAAEVDAFAGDHCPEVRGRFTDNMDGLRKLDILLDAVEPDVLKERLQAWRASDEARRERPQSTT